MRPTLLLLSALVVCWLGCKPEPAAPVAPEISIVEVTPTVVGAFEHPITITLHYADAQGDIGEPDPDNPSLRVRDTRLAADDWYHIPPLTPDLMELDIEGEFEVEIPPLFLLGNGDQESTTFRVQLFDRAGNASNEVITDNILILDTLL